MTGLLMHAQRALAVATTSSSSIGDQLQHLNLQVIYISVHDVDMCSCMHTRMYFSCTQHTNIHRLYIQLLHNDPSNQFDCVKEGQL